MASGGKRTGAGRPAPAGTRESITVRVAPGTKEILKKLKSRGFKLGKYLDESLAELAKGGL